MNIFISLSLLLLSCDMTHSAFVASTKKHIIYDLTKMMARPDSSNEIQEALRMSKEFGPNSKEAKVAWDIVEEIDASDNVRKAFELGSLDSMGLIQNEKDYVDNVNNLSNMLTNVIEPAITPIQTLISTLKDKEIKDPKMPKLGGPIPEVLADALAEAKAADDIYGPNSLKASDAWNHAEQVAMDMNIAGYTFSDVNSDTNKDHLRYKEAAMISHHDYSSVVDPQSLEDAMQALMKLEHLTRLVAIEKSRLGYYLHGKKDDIMDMKP
jgi:hypothetical protein